MLHGEGRWGAWMGLHVAHPDPGGAGQETDHQGQQGPSAWVFQKGFDYDALVVRFAGCSLLPLWQVGQR